MLNFVRDMDLFAVQVSLTYKGMKQFNTLLGGCCSLLLILVLATYSAVTLHDLIAHPVLKNYSQHEFFSFASNTDMYNITTKNSTLAIMIEGLADVNSNL